MNHVYDALCTGMAFKVISSSATLCGAVMRKEQGRAEEAFKTAFQDAVNRWDLAAKHGLLRAMLQDDLELGSMDLHYLVDEARLKSAEAAGLEDLISHIRKDREEFRTSPETCYKGNVVRTYWSVISK